MARNQMRANRGLTRRTARDHEDVLRDIETVLVRAARQFNDVDDAACHAAIESLLTDQPARDSLSAMLADGLRRVRRLHRDVTEEVWQDSLRVVARSIRNHSSREPGEVGYLAFVDLFIP